MPCRKLSSPGIKQLARLIKNKDVVVCVIAHHDQPALAVLHHFVAVDNRVGAGADFGPSMINFVCKAIVAYDQFLWLPVLVNNGKSK